MLYAMNPLVEGIAEPPIAEAQSWIAGRKFASDKPLLDLARAAPSYPPAESLRAHMAEFVSRPEASTYTEILGLPHLRTMLAAHMSAAYGGTIIEPNGVADDLGREAVTGIAGAGGCRHPTCLSVPIRPHKPASR